MAQAFLGVWLHLDSGVVLYVIYVYAAVYSRLGQHVMFRLEK
jgi:hypothetical protein